MELYEINFQNLLKFINTIDISESKFESDCGLSAGRLAEHKGDLTFEEYTLITKRYGRRLNDLGFLCIDRSSVDHKDPFMIIDINNQIE